MKMHRCTKIDEDWYLLELVELPWRARLATVLLDVTCGCGRHHLCAAPSWAYEVGVGAWKEWPDRRINLGNLWWAFGQRVLRSAEADWPILVRKEVPKADLPWLIRLRLLVLDTR